MACAGKRCWQVSAAGWQRALDTEQPIVRLQRLPDLDETLLLTSRQVLHSAGGPAWIPLEEGIGQPALAGPRHAAPARRRVRLRPGHGRRGLA